MTKISFSTEEEKTKLEGRDAFEALECLECEEKVRSATREMLEKGFIELYRCFESPRNLRIVLTSKGREFFASGFKL